MEEEIDFYSEETDFDLPEKEIATVLGMRLGTVKSSLHRALARLQMEVER